jgi:hypothetical protein
MANKSVSIKNATDKELDELIIRLRKESELQNIIADIKRKSLNEFVPWDNPKISTEEAISELYHSGVLGMKWGKRNKRVIDKKSIYDKQVLKEQKRRQRILSDPRLLAKHRKEFDMKEIEQALKDFRLEKELKQLSAERIQRGAKTAESIMSFAKFADQAYKLYKGPLGQSIVKKLTK